VLAAGMSKPFHLLKIISMTLENVPYADVIDIRFGKQRGSLTTKRDEIDLAERLPKPDWTRVRAASPSGRFRETKDIVRTNKLVTVSGKHAPAHILKTHSTCCNASSPCIQPYRPGPASRSGWARPMRKSSRCCVNYASTMFPC